ncbi:hypothetical protein Glove_196g125 [Diversispora epigaea]|uniref:Uncharacterized protein n=1 Tax=Diversispora epigaea TaxID=1348612 RepID=A0A397INK9_9GLOM|nr:hypothetical protein Glove_196g125 [Diversispora epigaea]
MTFKFFDKLSQNLIELLSDKDEYKKIEWNAKLKGVCDKSYYYSLKFDIKTSTEQEKCQKDFVENDSSLTEMKRNFYLMNDKNNFRNWASKNNEINKLIQECQQTAQTAVKPVHIIEWISYDRFKNVKYLAKEGCATISSAIWKDGCYYKMEFRKTNIGKIWKTNNCFEKIE